MDRMEENMCINLNILECKLLNISSKMSVIF